MNAFRPLLAVLLFPLLTFAAERDVKIDKAGSFLDVDVDATIDFTAHLDAFDVKVKVDEAGKVKSATFGFKFADLKTGKPDRDADMLKWLGGDSPEGRFEMGNLAVAPDGQGQVSGRLTFHGVTERVEFPVSVTKANGSYTITGETTLDYRNWKLKIIRKAFLFSVAPEVKVRFKLSGTPAVEPAK